MKHLTRSLLKSILAASACALTAALPANAQLLLTGTATGEFADPGLSYTVVSNGPLASTFSSGVPNQPNAPFFDTKTSIKFTSSSFADVGDGDLLDLGSLTFTNGVTKLGTTAKTAALDLYLNLPADGISHFKLTTLLFTIDSTVNALVFNVPDLFYVGHTDVNSLWFHGTQINFDLQFTNPDFSTGSGAAINEGKSAIDGIYAYVHFTPVPEPSTYALWGAALLMGFVAVKRFRPAPRAV